MTVRTLSITRRHTAAYKVAILVADGTEHLPTKISSSHPPKSVRPRSSFMNHLIHGDTGNTKYLQETGLEIRDWRDSEYADLVVVVKRSNHPSS